MINKYNSILVSPNTKIKDVLEKINQAPHNHLPSGIALIVNDSNSLLGIVTDGDIRRALLDNHNLDELVDVIMNKSPFTITELEYADKNNNYLSNYDGKLKTITQNILIINDLMRMLIIQVVVQVLVFLRHDHLELFSTLFIENTLFILAGILIYWLVFNNIILFTNKEDKEDKDSKLQDYYQNKYSL